MAQATVFNDDPAAQARAFEAQGFRYLHIVDLNGAFAGKPVNAPAVEAILRAVSIPVQLGGGIRDLATIEMWLGKGVRRVILGTVAVRDPGAGARGLPALSGPRSRSASMRVAARSRSRAGPRPSELGADRARAALRGRRRRRHHLHRHRPRRRTEGPQSAGHLAELAARSIAIPVIASGRPCRHRRHPGAAAAPNTLCLRAPSPAARSTTAASMPRGAQLSWRQATPSPEKAHRTADGELIVSIRPLSNLPKPAAIADHRFLACAGTRYQQRSRKDS